MVGGLLFLPFRHPPTQARPDLVLSVTVTQTQTWPSLDDLRG